MSDDSVYASQELTDDEWRVVDTIKHTMKILAKAIAHQDPEAVKKDIDPQGEMEEEELAELVKKHLTPDLPALNAHEEAVVIGQLGPLIFSELVGLKKRDGG